MTDNAPSISVIMSVYNDAIYLREAVESILQQSFTDFEFIIVDDCSTDGSSDILVEFCKQDIRIKLISNKENRGLTVSLNKGLELARGEFIARMDSDDIAIVDRFEKQIAYMNEHLDCVALSGKVSFIDDDGLKLGEVSNPLKHDAIEEELWQGLGLSMVHAAVMFRKNAVGAVGGYRIEAGSCEDLDLYLRLGEVGLLANLDDELLLVRRHYESVSAVTKRKKRNFLHRLIGLRRAGLKSEEGPQWRMGVLRRAAERRGMDINNIKLFDFSTPRSRAEWHADIAWRAYKQGYKKAAYKHSRLAVRNGAFEYLAWRAFLYLGNGVGRRILARRSS